MLRGSTSARILWAYSLRTKSSPGDATQFSSEAERPLPLTVRIREACRITGISRSKLYELIKDGRLKTIKVGAITLIPMAELTAFLGLGQP